MPLPQQKSMVTFCTKLNNFEGSIFEGKCKMVEKQNNQSVVKILEKSDSSASSNKN